MQFKIKEILVLDILDDGFIDTVNKPPLGMVTIKYSDSTSEERKLSILECSKLRYDCGLISSNEYNQICRKYIFPFYGD